ncbi:MAG: hypothetical protein J1E07_10265 [Treponema sp.]|nr:hypothetical protein [Treponema sp.]
MDEKKPCRKAQIVRAAKRHFLISAQNIEEIIDFLPFFMQNMQNHCKNL